MQYLSQRQFARKQRTELVGRPSYRFRVLARRRRGAPDIIWLTNERRYAIDLAEQLDALIAKQWLANPSAANDGLDSICSVCVECWTEESAGSLWQEVWPPCKVDAKEPKARRNKRPNMRPLGLPKSGDLVECILLAEKTRRGGWKAKLVKSDLVGPITNSSDVPPDTHPNKTVTLRIGAISDDGKHLQLVWKKIKSECQYSAKSAKSIVSPCCSDNNARA